MSQKINFPYELEQRCSHCLPRISDLENRSDLTPLVEYTMAKVIEYDSIEYGKKEVLLLQCSNGHRYTVILPEKNIEPV